MRRSCVANKANILRVTFLFRVRRVSVAHFTYVIYSINRTGIKDVLSDM